VAIRNKKYPGDSWLARYRERVNADQELSAIRDWFIMTFSLTLENDRYALRIEKGKITDVLESQKLDVRTLFGFRAPLRYGRNA
jgi:hypothetical protein